MAVYDPAGFTTAGKFPLYVLPALADATLAGPKVAEITAGTQIDYAISTFSSTSDQATRDRKMLSDTVAEQIGGAITRSLDTGQIAAMDPQGTDALKSMLVEGETLYLVALPGLPTTTAPAAAQKAWVWKATVGTLDAGDINAEDGNEFTWQVGWTKVSRNLDATVAV